MPSSTLIDPWVAFQGDIDQVCDAKAVAAYVKQVTMGKLVPLQHVGHGFSVQKNWLPQLRQELTAIEEPQSQTAVADTGIVKGLPLVEVPDVKADRDVLAVIISGDGGWASIDRQLGDYFSSQGIPTVGLNSLKYFWVRRTPDSAAIDLQRIIDHYSTVWQKKKLLLVGYSRGADVLPFMANRLPQDIKARVLAVALLGLEDSVDFKFHLSDWLGGSSNKEALPVKPEVEKLAGMKVLCFCGESEDNSLCLRLDTTVVKAVRMGGGHHFGGNYKTIAEIIFNYVFR